MHRPQGIEQMRPGLGLEYGIAIADFDEAEDSVSVIDGGGSLPSIKACMNSLPVIGAIASGLATSGLGAVAARIDPVSLYIQRSEEHVRELAENRAAALILLRQQDELRLRHQRAQAAVGARDLRLPNHGGAAAMQRRAFGAAVSPTGMAAKKLVLLSIVVVPAPSGRLTTVATRADIVGERHDGAAVNNVRAWWRSRGAPTIRP